MFCRRLSVDHIVLYFLLFCLVLLPFVCFVVWNTISLGSPGWVQVHSPFTQASGVLVYNNRPFSILWCILMHSFFLFPFHLSSSILSKVLTLFLVLVLNSSLASPPSIVCDTYLKIMMDNSIYFPPNDLHFVYVCSCHIFFTQSLLMGTRTDSIIWLFWRVPQ
jgi:hypothetical protein